MRRWSATKLMLVANLISNPWNIIQNLRVDSLSLKSSSNLVLGASKRRTLKDFRAKIFYRFIAEVPHHGHINVLHVTAVPMQGQILWIVKPYSGLSSYRFLDEVHCLHLQVLLAPPSLYLDYPALHTKPIPSLESSVNLYQSTRLNIQEEMDLPHHCCERLKSRTAAILGESFNVFKFAVCVHVRKHLEVHVTIS